ncbi:MAG TPA: peptidylprolyl isomerase [Thermoanaerobaculia bacterium]|nr:peptidylprolyl isomerase [Thermoanaerobaculia bacterium]
MTRHSSPTGPKLLSLSLALSTALLLAGSGCSHASEGEQAKAQAAPSTAAPGATAAKPGASAPGAATAPAGTAAKPAGAPEAISPEKLPAVVAKVNGQEIKKDELLKEADGVKAQLGQNGNLPPALPATFYRQVLDGMIARHLLQQEATAQGVTVTDDEVKTQVAQLRGQFPNPEEFNKALAAQGLTEQQFLQTAKQQLTVRKYIQTKILEGAPAANDAAIKAFYDQNQDKMKQPERVHLRHILVKVDPSASAADKQKARAKADGVLARVKKGEDFAKLAKENSDDPGSKDNGGDLNWAQRGQFVEPFEKAAWALKKDEVSPVVESQFGYHVIQLLDRQDASVLPFEQVKPRIAEFLKQKQSQEQVQVRIQALRAKAKVETFI